MRSELRAEACSAVAMAAWMIDGDTNGVDHAREPWAGGFEIGDAVVSIADEKARMKFQEVDIPALGALMLTVAPDELRHEDAMGQAQAMRMWWGRVRAADTNAVLGAEEEIMAAQVPAPGALARALPHLGVHGDGKVNVNTVGREVFLSMVLGTGADIGVAETLYARVVRSRNRSEHFAALDLQEAGKLLAGSGDALSPGEMRAVQALLPALCVESGVFRITARASRGGVAMTVQCVYDRQSRRILRWLEF